MSDTKADLNAENVVCPHVCPNRPGRGHEWYLRTSDRLRFCRDCGYDWVPLPTQSDGQEL